MEKLKVQMDECEITGLTAVQAGGLHLHHVLLRSQGGDDIAENILCINHDLHEAYHRHERPAWHAIGKHVRRRRPDTWSYLLDKIGEDARDDWLMRHIVG